MLFLLFLLFMQKSKRNTKKKQKNSVVCFGTFFGTVSADELVAMQSSWCFFIRLASGTMSFEQFLHTAR